MKYFQYCCVALAWLLLSGCWANPSLVRIQSDPPGARVFFNEKDLGVTPLSQVLACTEDTQYVRLELVDQPTQNIPLYRKPIRYFVPWYAVVAAGVFSFKTTWRSEACIPENITVKLANRAVPTPLPAAPSPSKPPTEIQPQPETTPAIPSPSPPAENETQSETGQQFESPSAIPGTTQTEPPQ